MPKRKPIEPKSSAPTKSGDAPNAAQAPVRRILRSQIQLAAYNPRSISSYAREKLAESLSRYGLVETPVWNEITGNLVSGHQRISILDKEHGWPGADYSLEVSVVRLPLKQEKQLNVWLNNRAAQGNFAREPFQQLFADEPGLKLEDLGMTAIDLDFEFGDAGQFAELFQKENAGAAEVVKSAEEMAQHRQAMRQKRNREELRQENSVNSDGDYYLMVVFPSRTAKEEWLKQHGFPETSRYLNHQEYEAACKPAAAVVTVQ